EGSPGAPGSSAWGAASRFARVSADHTGAADAAPESAEPAKPDSSASAPGAPVHASADRDSRRCSAACLCSVAFVLADALFLRRQSITELAAARGVSGPSPPAL